jgi:hypothetical protein
MQMLKILSILLTIPMTLMGMEKTEYEPVPVIHQPLLRSMKAGDVNPEIKSKIQASYLSQGQGRDTSIEMHENNTVFYTKQLGKYRIAKEDIDVEMANVFNQVFPQTHRTIGTQVSTFSPEPFKDVLRRACIKTLPALCIGSMTSVIFFTLIYAFNG